MVGSPLNRGGFAVRAATPADCAELADLHAASMRRAYRGILPDDSLDAGLRAERLAAWTERLGRSGGAVTLVAESGDALVGLAHVVCDADPEWGSLLESLHVAPSVVGRGIGAALFDAVAEHVEAEAVGRGLYLWVYEANIDACRFYDRLDGRVSGSKVADDGGGATPSLRYWWPEPGGS